MADYDYRFKIIMLGDPGVGKSCLLGRWATNQFYNNFISTIGVDFQTKSIVIDDKRVQLVLWDTAGQEQFSNLTKGYFRGTHGIIIAFDITDRHSFQAVVNGWLQKADNWGGSHAVKVLVGTKTDLESNRKVTFKEAEKFARERGLTFIETSAKENVNIDELFTRTAHEILVTLFTDATEWRSAKGKQKLCKEQLKPSSGCCLGHSSSPNLSCGDVYPDYIPRGIDNEVSVSYPEEKSSDATAWKKNMEDLYKENKSLFESYRIRSGWFISYKQDDRSDVLAERLYRDLDGDNWFDMYYNKTRTRAAMIKGILRRDKFICFVSPNYFKSQWCVLELTTAFCSGKTIVPVFNQDYNGVGSLLSLVPDCFSALKTRDFTGLFADTGPYRGQLNKVVTAGRGNFENEFYDSEIENT